MLLRCDAPTPMASPSVREKRARSLIPRPVTEAVAGRESIELRIAASACTRARTTSSLLAICISGGSASMTRPVNGYARVESRGAALQRGSCIVAAGTRSLTT